MGRRQSVNDSLYFYIVDKIVETAIAQHVEWVELGLTTYPIKQDFGAQLMPIDMALWLTIPGLNRALPYFYGWLQRTPTYVTKRVFKPRQAASLSKKSHESDHSGTEQ